MSIADWWFDTITDCLNRLNFLRSITLVLQRGFAQIMHDAQSAVHRYTATQRLSHQKENNQTIRLIIKNSTDIETNTMYKTIDNTANPNLFIKFI